MFWPLTIYMVWIFACCLTGISRIKPQILMYGLESLHYPQKTSITKHLHWIISKWRWLFDDWVSLIGFSYGVSIHLMAIPRQTTRKNVSHWSLSNTTTNTLWSRNHLCPITNKNKQLKTCQYNFVLPFDCCSYVLEVDVLITFKWRIRDKLKMVFIVRTLNNGMTVVKNDNVLLND